MNSDMSLMSLNPQDLYSDESILSPANFFFNDPNFFSITSIGQEPMITVDQGTPIPSPINKIIPSSIALPNNMTPFNMNLMPSPLTSPFDINPSMMFFPSTLASPTFELFPTETMQRRYSTPGSFSEFYGEQSQKPKQRRSSLRKLSIKSDTTPTKLYVCEEQGCTKVFKRSEHLKRHVKSIHSQERPFECPHPGCHKKFARSDNLNQHSRIHRTTEEKMLSRGFTSFTPFVLPHSSELQSFSFM